MLDELLEQILSKPFLALLILAFGFAGFMFPSALFLGIGFYLAARKQDYAEYIYLAFGVATLGLMVYILSPHAIWLVSKGLRTQIMLGHWWVMLTPWSLVPSIPIAICLGGLLLIQKKMSSTISHDVRRLGKGKLKLEAKELSDKAIEKCMSALKSSASSSGSVLGISVETGGPIILSDQNANLHTLAIGTTGSGKTTALNNIIESAIIRKLPIIIVDGKGDIALMERIRDFVNQHERPFYGFSMVGPSVKYNPLATGGVTSKKDRIIELRDWSEDHYRKIAEGYLQTVFLILEKANIKIDLCQLARYLDVATLRALAREREDRALADMVLTLADKTEDISSLKAEIENLVNSEIGSLFDSHDGSVLELPKALDENAVIYFCLQPLAFPAYANNLGKLIINDIKALAATQLQNETRKTIYTIFDEFSVFAGDQIVNLINQGRSAGIHAILSTQSLSDISKVGGSAFVGQVLNNCNNYLIQRQNNPEDSEILAKVVGTKNDIEYTSQISIRDGKTSQGSVRAVKGYLIHPDEIKRLGMGEGYYINKQQYQVVKLKFRRGLSE